YNRFRYYSPHEGMYTQQDPIRLAGGIQLYGYVHDPNTWVDVFGLKGKQNCNPLDANSNLSKNAELLRTGGKILLYM
ncbi:RHS repeat-associated core domain-containing protein, partial [Paenibacillus ehimensis]|uniref:RHS repeat-associated core domain-containing protein n=1 Tax=Paenibacillus ehimensis TaxID=79264 RepID=UPI001C3FDE48